MSFSNPRLIFFLVLVVFFARPGAAAESAPTPESQPESAASRPRKYESFGKPRHLPFSAPYYLLKGVTYPIQLGADFVENHPKVLHPVEFMSNSRKSYSVYPIITVGDGGKFGGGAGIAHLNLFKQTYAFNTWFIIYQDLDAKAKLTLANPRAFSIGSMGFAFDFQTFFWKDSDEDYYGIGTDTPESNKAEYSFNHVKSGAWFGFQVIPNLFIGPHLIFDTMTSGPGGDGNVPGVEDFFPPQEINGFGERSSYLDIGFGIAHDTRDPRVNHQHGGLQRAGFHYFQSVDGSGFEFFQLELLFEHYINLGRPRWTLLLRNEWVFQQATGKNDIPFYRLAVLDSNHWLRGFDRGRFHDKASVVFNAEFYFPLWRLIDGIAYADTGRVFNGIKDFSFDGFRYSVGGGVRLTINRFYQFRLDAATGGEGVNVNFRALQVF